MSGRPLRLLLVAHGYPPREQAGAELCCHWLARELLRRGHAVQVFTRTSDPALPPYTLLRERIDGVPVARLRTAPERATSLRDQYVDAQARAAFERELAQGHDIVHFHHLLGLSTDLVAAAQEAGVRTVVTLHDFWHLCPRGQRYTPSGHLCHAIEPWRCSLCIAKKRARWAWQFALKERLAALVAGPRYLLENLHTAPIRRRTREILAQLNRADRILAPSRFLLDEHVRHGLDAARTRFVENGIDGTWVARLPRKEAPGRPLRFGFIGTFLPSKGVDLLLEAFRGVAPELGTLDLHGTSPWDGGAFARRLERTSHAANVRFHGAFAHERLPEILAALDVLVVPSRWYENAPVTLDEAALAELPVVVAGQGGMGEWLDRRKNGLAFKPGDAADLREQCLRLARDAQLWHRLRRPDHPVQGTEQAAAEAEALYRELLAVR